MYIYIYIYIYILTNTIIRGHHPKIQPLGDIIKLSFWGALNVCRLLYVCK